MKKFLPWLLLLALAAMAFGFYRHQQQQALPDYLASSNGRLELARLDVASLHAGRVARILVDEGDVVQAGDVLAQLSASMATHRVAEAQAGKAQADGAMGRAQAADKQARGAVERANAQIAAQKQQLTVAQLELDNAIRLHQDNLVSAAEVQRRRSQRDGAAAAVSAAQAAKMEAQAAVGQAQAGIREAQAGTQRAQALVQTAQSANDDMNIVAPKAGRVAYRLVDEGSVIGAGSKVLSILNPDDVSMAIFLPNRQMARLKVGDEARIVLDDVQVVLPAKIVFIASEAQFTPKAVETKEERAKLMFKVKLKVPSETAQQLNGWLKGGMTGNGVVRLDTKQNWPSDLAIQLPQ